MPYTDPVGNIHLQGTDTYQLGMALPSMGNKHHPIPLLHFSIHFISLQSVEELESCVCIRYRKILSVSMENPNDVGDTFHVSLSISMPICALL